MIIIQNTIKSTKLPSEQWLRLTSNKILFILKKLTIIKANELQSDIVIRIVDIDEITQLNHKYRGKNTPTNILSFPNTLTNDILTHITKQLTSSLGDLVVCFVVIEDEANKYNKTIPQHLTHILTHGILHLLEYDHITDKQAQQMQDIEIKVLVELDIPNPY